MSITKKDFEAIAEAVAEAKRVVEYTWADGDVNRVVGLNALEVATRELATACASRYEGGLGFKRQRFVEACGFPEV